jgi:hypothetical protein
MEVAFGWKAHTGWAALVVVGRGEHGFLVVDRRRVALVDEAWARQPYHAAEALDPEAAGAMVARGIDVAHQGADRAVRAAVARERKRENRAVACGVMVGNPMPGWTVDEIRAVHFRMHKAEGVLYQDALVAAARASGLRVLTVPEKGPQPPAVERQVAVLGKGIGPPWGKDQREAALTALVALSGGAA